MTNALVTDPLLVQGGYIFKTDKTSPGSTAWSTSRGISIQSADPEAWKRRRCASFFHSRPSR